MTLVAPSATRLLANTSKVIVLSAVASLTTMTFWPSVVPGCRITAVTAAAGATREMPSPVVGIVPPVGVASTIGD